MASIHPPTLRSPREWNPLRIHFASILVACSAVLLLISFGLYRVIDRTEQTGEYARAQFLAGQAGMDAGRALEILSARPDAPREMPPGRVVELSTLVGGIARATDEIDTTMEDGSGDELASASSTAQAALQDFLDNQTAQSQQALTQALVAVGVRVNQLLPVIDARVAKGNSSTLNAASVVLAWLLVCVPIGGSTVAFTAWCLGRRMRAALLIAAEEQRNLEHSAATMKRRNGQFQALYNVITEVTESLSLRHVVETTLRETSRLVAADVVVVRLLEGDQLVVAGTSRPVDDQPLRSVTLGTGIVGKAARRGRSALVRRDAEKLMSHEERIEWAESGMVVPLIVGARVVGTLGCWARLPDVFDEEDQQVLEMMASQVAVAVAAASTHEASEREAHQDPLTGIPNRRQLARDIRDRFGPALEAGQRIAFAMVDIDHFKAFNDAHGHKAGDLTLQQVASMLRGSIRAVDHVYRYGGEEFTVVLDGVAGDDAFALMERVRLTVGRAPLVGKDGEPVDGVTISSGIACGPQNGTDCELLMRLADDALYQSKWTGRDRTTLYSESIIALAA